MTHTAATGLRGKIGAGLAWSTLNSLVLRVGNFAVGIILARLLVPEQFGVFAVALTVQAVLMTLADLGMSTDLIRSENADEKAPTVATLALVSGATLTAVMAASADRLADLLGSSQAGPVISVLALSLILSSAGVVPYATLQRQFAQNKLFLIALMEFAFGTSLTIGLLLGGWGVMSLAVARIAAQLLTLVLQFILSGERVRFGFDPRLASGILKFGLPVSLANMLSWALLNVDNVAVSRLAGPVALGFYFLAFNVSNWPMSALGQVVRSVSIPAFARLATAHFDQSFAVVAGPVWAVSLLAGMMLAVLAEPVIELIYGPTWSPAAGVLVWLGLFGSLRTLFDLSASYLLARGAAKATFLVQVAWVAALVPAVIIGVNLAGTTGAALAHLATAIVVVCTAYALALRSNGVDVRAVISRLWPPAAAAVPAAAASVAAMAQVPSPLGSILAGGASGLIVYAVLLGSWFRSRVRETRDWLPTDTSLIEPDVSAAGR